VTALGHPRLERHYRALLETDDVDPTGADAFGGTLASPLAVVRSSSLAANITAMQRWCDDHGVVLAPHGKTTMAPALFRRQLEAGAWGITVASPAQGQVALAAGAQRVLIANEVTDVAGIRWLGRTLSDRPEAWICCYVDSLTGVQLLDDGLDGVLAEGARAEVLVELGVAGGRTGARSQADAVRVAEAVKASRHLRLAGVSGYEGVAAGSGGPQGIAAVDAFCAEVGALARRLVDDGLVEPSDDRPLVLSAGGSAYFDHVASGLAAVRESLSGTPAVVVLRSGAYVTHDHGLYARTTPTARGGDGPQLVPAFEVWGRVLSRPEPTRAIVDVGRRDAPFDQDLPFALWSRPVAGGPRHDLAATVVSLNDQHAFLDLAGDEPLDVGQWVGFGISHPCTAVDKWNVLVEVDDADRVVGLLPTYF
jgi:D-serine deaminase-like pyridoxal phosphate-dependent protein